MSLLGMEKLDDLPEKILKSASEIFKHKKACCRKCSSIRNKFADWSAEVAGGWNCPL